MADNPGVSIPSLCETPYDVKAVYKLLQHPESTPDNLQRGHRRLVLKLLKCPGIWLLVEDTSEFIWKSKQDIEGLGPTGASSKYAQGFLLHSVLAVRWANELNPEERRPALDVAGIAHQLYEVRKPVPEGEDGNNSFARKSRKRESHLWNTSTDALGHAPSEARWVRVCDRAADIYEFLRGCQEHGHGFVVRANQDRALLSGGFLFERARELEPVGSFQLTLRDRPQRPGRTAKMLVAACPVDIRSPQRPGAGPGRLPSVPCWVVRAWELDAPPGAEPLEWILLSDAPASTADEALRVVQQYATRWIVEDFHKALKTGLGAQRLQLESAHSLFAAISVMSVDALRLLNLRERLRIAPEAPAEEAGLEPHELEMLHAQTRRPLKTVQDVALAIGRLGGHMNRKADGMPGMITLWRGMNRLRNYVAGAMMASQLKGFG
jgi:hypothetical protein